MADIKDLIKQYNIRYPGTIGWRISKHTDVIQDYLNPGEVVTYAFYAQKNNEWYRITDTCVVALTNKRLLIGQKRLLWGSTYMQVTPDLYNDMEIYSGMFFGKVVIDTLKETIVLSNISKKSLDEIETNISEFMMKEKKNYHASKD